MIRLLLTSAAGPGVHFEGKWIPLRSPLWGIMDLLLSCLRARIINVQMGDGGAVSNFRQPGGYTTRRQFVDSRPSTPFSRLRARFWDSVSGRRRRSNAAWQRLQNSGVSFGLSQIEEPMLFSVKDDAIARRLFYTGSFDFPKFIYALEVLGVSRLARLIDVGANIGVVAVPAVARGLVDSAIAIEPDPLNFRLLECNVRLNAVQDQVQCMQVAATRDGVGEVLLELSPTNHGDHRIAAVPGKRTTHTHSIAVPSARLDDLLPSPSRDGDLLWMDVQGYEVEVLRGAPALLDSGMPLVLEVWPYGLAEQGSLAGLPEVLSGYRSFFDLSVPKGTWRPISDIEQLTDGLGLDIYNYADILVTR